MVSEAAPIIALFEAAKQLQDFSYRPGWRSCFIGGIAVQRWGEPRVTRYVDLALLAGFGREEAFIDTLLAAYPPRIGNAAEFARRNRVLLLQTPDGMGIDISLGALSFEERLISRATLFWFGPALDIRTCSAEDLMVLKLFASRPLDLADAEAMAIRNRGQLDWGYIEEQLMPLAETKADPAIPGILAKLRRL